MLPLITYLLTSQWPPFAGPIRFNWLFVRNLAICFSTALVLISSSIASCGIVISGISARSPNIFPELFPEPISVVRGTVTVIVPSPNDILSIRSYSASPRKAAHPFALHAQLRYECVALVFQSPHGPWKSLVNVVQVLCGSYLHPILHCHSQNEARANTQNTGCWRQD